MKYTKRSYRDFITNNNGRHEKMKFTKETLSFIGTLLGTAIVTFMLYILAALLFCM